MKRSRLIAITGLVACTSGRTTNPPPPDPDTETNTAPVVETAPKGGLPSWDEVESGHPMGATNPPLPMLAVSADHQRCYKEWWGARVAHPSGSIGGTRLLAEGEVSEGTEIVCPPDRVARLVEQINPPTGEPENE